MAASEYTVSIHGEEWVVRCDGERARIGSTEFTLRPGLLPGEIVVESRDRRVRLLPQPSEGCSATVVFEGLYVEADVLGERDRLRSLYRSRSAAAGPIEVRSEIPGVIREVRRRAGDSVEAGEAILTLEAMKMENEVRADARGRVVTLSVAPGDKVNAGQLLAIIEPATE